MLAREPIRFLLVGATNTALGYILYSLFYVAFGHYIGYLGALYASYIIAIFVAFYLYRRFVFRSTGSKPAEFFKFASVYLVSLAINTVALPLLVEVVGIPPIPAQALSVIVTTLCSYLGHKFFSFRPVRGKQ
jgi:putative flippase GtrA